MPPADLRIDAALVQALLADQHPDLLGPLVLVAEGWDNVLFRLGNDLGVRLPKRAAAANLVENEQRWLSSLATLLPARIPVPIRVGRPSARFPWSWSILPWLEGTPASALPVPTRSGAARDLAGFMAALHVPAPAQAPINRVRGVPLAERDRVVRERLAARASVGGELLALWERLLPTPPWAGPPLWLHGDPHPGNVLLDEQGCLAAVLDFGDLTRGDPASDLAAAWLVFDPEGRASFRSRYNELTGRDPDTWRRAHAWALVLSTAFDAFSDNNLAMAAIAAHAREQVLGDPG